MYKTNVKKVFLRYKNNLIILFNLKTTTILLQITKPPFQQYVDSSFLLSKRIWATDFSHFTFAYNIFWRTQTLKCHLNLCRRRKLRHYNSMRFKRHKYSLLMHRMKIKSPVIFFYGMNEKFFLSGWIYLFSISAYSGGITMTKSPPDIGGTTIQDDDKTRLIHKTFPQDYDYELLKPK